MLNASKTVWIVNFVLIIATVALSLLTIHWHHQMFQLYKIEAHVKKENQSIMAVNRQLLMEHSELLSGMAIVEKSRELLMMNSPDKEIKILPL
jgi:cell division protein FtsL